MQELVKGLLTIAKEGTTVEDVEKIVSDALPGLRPQILEGVSKDDLSELAKSNGAFKALIDSSNSKAIETWRQNHLQTEIEKAVAERAPLKSVEDIQKRLESEPDPVQRSILEAKLDAAIARQENEQARKEREQAEETAKRERLRGVLGTKLAGKIGDDESELLDHLIGPDEESTAAIAEKLLSWGERQRAEAWSEFEKGAAAPGAGGGEGGSSGKRRSQMTDAERAAYMREHGVDAYRALPE